MGDVREKKLLEELAKTVVEAAQGKAPEVTGELKGSIDIISVSDTEAIVGHTSLDKLVVDSKYGKVIYPIFVHEGTGPYVIEPKEKKSLGWGGSKLKREYFAKRVKHPGIKAQPYFDEALKSPEIDNVISEYGDKTIKDLSLKLDRSWKKK